MLFLRCSFGNPFYPPSTCRPCLCDSEHTLRDCEVPSLIEREYDIDLEGKGIKRIAKGAFDFEGLGNLVSLKLSNNALEMIEAGAFEGLGNLGYLYLWGNELTCSSACGTCEDYSCCDNATACGW